MNWLNCSDNKLHVLLSKLNRNRYVCLYYTTAGPVMTGMDINVEKSPYNVICNSSGSPPTNVIWTFKGEVIDIKNGPYTERKELVDRHTSAYKNVLTINANLKEVLGNYSCRIVNDLGESDTMMKSTKSNALYT